MSRRYSIEEFVEQTRQKDRGQGLFELETERMLELNLNGTVWTKMGSMVSYRGNVKFTREGIMEQGIGNLLKKAVSGEGARLTKAEGNGQVYLADSGKKITILDLEGDSIIVNGKYRATANMVGSPTRLVDLINYLVTLETSDTTAAAAEGASD